VPVLGVEEFGLGSIVVGDGVRDVVETVVGATVFVELGVRSLAALLSLVGLVADDEGLAILTDDDLDVAAVAWERGSFHSGSSCVRDGGLYLLYPA